MKNTIIAWLQNRYQKIINSIAFYPAVIVILFGILSYGSITFDFSDTGQQFKSNLHWLSLKDATTARSIISSIVAGVISLSVFSFSMVMIVLNQAASQMSNRVLDKLIGNRFQQVVLGIYIGTIVYALFLLSTIRDIDSGLYIPALSTYLLILLTVFDICLFIYFLHYITQSVKYQVIIEKIYDETKAEMEAFCCLKEEKTVPEKFDGDYILQAHVPGVFEGVNAKALLKICKEKDFRISFLQYPGSFVMKGIPIARLDKKPSEELTAGLNTTVLISDNESVERNFLYGFRQLAEVAVKALSPGINDPGTAIISLRSLMQLLAYRANYFPDTSLEDDEHVTRIYTKADNFDAIFAKMILPIWDYGKNDRMLRNELQVLLVQLQDLTHSASVGRLLQTVTAHTPEI